MSGRGTLSATIPPPASPIAGPGGAVTVPWRAWFLVLERRTGGTVGASPAESFALIEAEQVARIAADQALQLGLDVERSARIAGDNALAAADQTINLLLSGVSTALGNEIVRAMAAEALLVPLDQLCSLWAACDLSFLPTTDPGGGKPWLDGSHLVVSTPVIALVGVGLEDGTGRWGLEDGTGAWQWG